MPERGYTEFRIILGLAERRIQKLTQESAGLGFQTPGQDLHKEAGLHVAGQAMGMMIPSSAAERYTGVLNRWRQLMEWIANLHIEQLPEGYYLATSEDIPGLIAQGRTIEETLEIARDVARKLIEAQSERQQGSLLKVPGQTFDIPVVVGG